MLPHNLTYLMVEKFRQQELKPCPQSKEEGNECVCANAQFTFSKAAAPPTINLNLPTL